MTIIMGIYIYIYLYRNSIFITLILLVANLANAKWCKKTEKILKPGYSSASTQQELSNEYQHDKV